MKYFATYNCPLCDTLILYGESHEVPEDKVPDLLGRFVQNQRFYGNPYLHNALPFIPHKCKDGSLGLAMFAGFKVDHS